LNIRGVETPYLFYALQHAERAFNGMGQPGTQTNLNTSLVSRYRIYCPDQAPQHQIAGILSTVDDAIEHTEAQITKYQQITTGLMNDLFTRGVTPQGHLRPPRSEASHLYHDSPLGWLPKGWEVATTGSCLTGIEAGKSPECPDTPASGDQWGVLKVGAVDPQGFRESENKVVLDERLHNSAFLVHENDLLLSRANTFDLVGLVCHVTSGPRNLMLSDKTLRLRADKSRVTMRFMFWALQSASARRQIENHAAGTSGSMKNISQRSVRAIVLPRPAISEQSLITLRLDAAVETIATLRTHRATFQHLKHGLMRDLLSGRVRLNIEGLGTT
jgi:type I restriction enzyme S subunit